MPAKVKIPDNLTLLDETDKLTQELTNIVNTDVVVTNGIAAVNPQIGHEEPPAVVPPTVEPPIVVPPTPPAPTLTEAELIDRRISELLAQVESLKHDKLGVSFAEMVANLVNTLPLDSPIQVHLATLTKSQSINLVYSVETNKVMVGRVSTNLPKTTTLPAGTTSTNHNGTPRKAKESFISIGLHPVTKTTSGKRVDVEATDRDMHSKGIYPKDYSIGGHSTAANKAYFDSKGIKYVTTGIKA